MGGWAACFSRCALSFSRHIRTVISRCRPIRRKSAPLALSNLPYPPHPYAPSPNATSLPHTLSLLKKTQPWTPSMGTPCSSSSLCWSSACLRTATPGRRVCNPAPPFLPRQSCDAHLRSCATQKHGCGTKLNNVFPKKPQK